MNNFENINFDPILENSTNTIHPDKLDSEPLPFKIQSCDYKKFLLGIEPNSVDLILTDPPYNISRQTGFSNVGKNSVARFAVSMDFGEWDHKPIKIKSFSKLSHKVLRQGGTIIVWYDIWKLSYLADAMTDAGFKMIRLIVWNKTNPVPLNSKSCYLSNSREMAVLGVKGGKPTFNGEYDDGNYHYPIPRHNGKKIHPTQKPLNLFNDLVLKHSNPGDWVVDPFLGSGTTGVAAVRNNRLFMGCDIDNYYPNCKYRPH